MKTRLRNRLCDETFDEAMIVSIEGPDTLLNEDLDTILKNKNLEEWVLLCVNSLRYIITITSVIYL